MPESKDIKRLQKIQKIVFKKKYLPIFKKQVRCKTELKKEIIKLGGTPVEDGSNKGYLIIFWFNLKTYLFIRI
jgi:hypothetical protein